MSKPLDRITLLESFVRISDTGSISAAARDLGLSQPSVSRQLAELESRLKTQLVRRTTHSLTLTNAGQDLLIDARQILDSWDALEEKHLASETEIQGKLKVIGPVAFGQVHLARIVYEFQLKYPGVSLTWELRDEEIRFAQSGCDCWIRIGPVPDDNLIVRRIGSVPRQLVASKEFISQFGTPKTLTDVKKLPLVTLDRYEGAILPLSNNGKTARIEPEVKLRTNNIFALKEAVLMGIGMAILPRWFVASELRKGKLIEFLPKWKTPTLDANVAYLPNRHQPLRLRAFLRYLEDKISRIDGMAGP